jgi:hypothetical protein
MNGHNKVSKRERERERGREIYIYIYYAAGYLPDMTKGRTKYNIFQKICVLLGLCKIRACSTGNARSGSNILKLSNPHSAKKNAQNAPGPMRNAQLPFRMFCARSAGLETAANSKYEAKTVKRWHLK